MSIFKGSTFFKIDIFLSKKGFINWYNYGINMIIKCGIWQPVKFQLVCHFWTGSKMKCFFFFSELMLATLIQRYYKESFHFWSNSRTRDYLKFKRLSGATFYNRINIILYQFIKPFFDNTYKMSLYEEYGAFNINMCVFGMRFWQGLQLQQYQDFREKFWSKFWISLYILYIFTSLSSV